MKKGSVLVLGGAGYIGTHTVVELVGAGYGAVIADSLSNSEASAVEGVRRITGVDVPFEQVDACDEKALRGLFERYSFDAAIHFAAFKAVGESVQKPLLYYRNNLTSFMNLCSLMREFGRPGILFSSSATVYGEADVLPVTERSPRMPAASPYGKTKQVAEDILHDCCAAYAGMRGIALRYFNPIGAHPSALIGDRRIWCLTSRRRPPASALVFRFSVTTTIRPMAHVCATISMWSTWPGRMWRLWNVWRRGA